MKIAWTSISNGYLDTSHSLTTIDGIDCIVFVTYVVVRFNVRCFFEVRLASGPLVEKNCDFSNT